ncbi:MULTISPECIES: hypothetical protein [unclassified Pseudoalteromonas]|uniref:hypothetical protein n=1 Tax=unclassified Pseudoalteromonas TaxID=194690 RepID=UPI000FDE9484
MKRKGTTPYCIFFFTYWYRRYDVWDGRRSNCFLPYLNSCFFSCRLRCISTTSNFVFRGGYRALGATINPFSVIIASNSAGINWTVGTGLRVVILITASIIVYFIFFTM